MVRQQTLYVKHRVKNVQSDSCTVMGRHKILRRAFGHNTGWVNGFMAGVVMDFGISQVNRAGDIIELI